jgi:acyl-CoA synthetase (AMP-forming)/AMP-acid ligase II
MHRTGDDISIGRAHLQRRAYVPAASINGPKGLALIADHDLPTVHIDGLHACRREIGSSQRSNELSAQCPSVMQGYLNRPEETRAVIGADGWLHTGDLGYADAAGCCLIVDRLKELIKYKGYAVAPAELEGLLLSHSQVADACIVGHADAEAGEVPKAFIVAKGSVSADALIDFVASNVAPYKRIRAVEFMDALPRSSAGKLLRRVLLESDRASAQARNAEPIRNQP